MNKKEVKKTPTLRFKGFTNDWEQRKLGEIAKVIGGGTPSTKNSDYWNGNINWYSPTEIGKSNYIFTSKKKITKLGLENSSAKILPGKHTILFTSRAGIGNMAIMQTDGCTNQGFQSWVIDNNTNIYFLYSLGSDLKKEAIRKASGSTFLEISNKEVKKIPLSIPSKHEQDKLGKLFLVLDNLLSLHQRKLKLLRTLKSGLSFKLFNKKHLNNLSQISLDQIGQTYSGLTGKSKKDFGHGHAFYVSYLNVNQNEIGNPKQIDRIEIDKKQNLVQKNDIFFTISSETPEEVGLTSLWPVSCKNLYLNSFCFGFRINTKMFIPLYLGYLFRSEYFREKVLPLAQGISRYNLSKNNVLKIKIGQEEIAIQEKYAKVMNDLDSDILRQKKKVKELKLCKKFLLQNMFI